MKEFSRGKNEKDLSTSCLMRHVRRAHPTVLIQENGTMPNISSFSSPTLLLPPQSADMGDLSSMLSPIKLVKKMASKIPSPDRIIEESVSIVSSEEIADLSVSEKCNKEEVMVGSSPQLPNNQYDETVENVAEKTVVIPKNTSGSRRRSAVWKHFYLSPLDNSKAVCIHCMNEFSRGKKWKRPWNELFDKTYVESTSFHCPARERGWYQYTTSLHHTSNSVAFFITIR